MSDNLFLADNAAEDKTLNSEAVQPVWHTAEPGFQLQPAEVCVSRDHQNSKLAACGINPSDFGDFVDPAFFIGIGIQAGIRSGISAQGNINMLQRLVVHRPARLGEVLWVRGKIEAVQPVPRGDQVTTTIRIEDDAGELLINASRTSLRPGPKASRSSQIGGGAGERPAPVVAHVNDTVRLAAHALTPEQVKDYSLEGNSIHYEEEAAKAAGFRAPMIGGGMGVHFLTAALFSRSVPSYVDMDIYFRRPIFWDEQFSSAVMADTPVVDGSVVPELEDWSALCLWRDEGDKGYKVLTEARINALNLPVSG